MIKRIVVAGCRDYDNYNELASYIDSCLDLIGKNQTFVFVSGGCKGADQLGERYAKEHNFKIEKYPANWDKYGKHAGPIRNEQMAIACDYVICFWDGKSLGTKSMIKYAKQYKKTMYIKQI